MAMAEFKRRSGPVSILLLLAIAYGLYWIADRPDVMLDGATAARDKLIEWRDATAPR